MFDKLKAMVQTEVQEKASEVATKLPDWSKASFDKVIDTTAYSQRRDFIAQKYTDLIAESDEDPEMDKKLASQNSFDNTKEKSNDTEAKSTVKQSKREEDQSEAMVDFDPNNKNQELMDRETGELFAGSLNQLSPSEIAEQAIVSNTNQEFDSKKDQEVAKSSSKSQRLTRKQYRALMEHQSNEKTVDNDISVNKDKPLHKADVSDSSNLSRENIDSLESVVPPEDYGQSFDPSSKIDIDDNQSYKPMHPSKDDLNVVNNYLDLLTKEWQEYSQSNEK